MKNKILTISFSFFAVLFLQVGFAVNCANYPHWKQCSTNKQLAHIDAYIHKYAHKGYVAAFDWDGTLYNEKIPLQLPRSLKGQKFAGQPAWMIWAAQHLQQHPSWFPMFQTRNGAGKLNLINQNLYTEGKTNAKLGEYSKFSTIAAYPAGMTPVEVSQSMQGYLKACPVAKNAFLPMFDILQQMHKLGYKIWIVTGSNPYFVSNLIYQIEKTVPYKKGVTYRFGILSTPYPNKFNPTAQNHIAGNDTLLMKNGRFSMVYNSRFVTGSDKVTLNKKRYIVDREGKALAISHYIEPRFGKVILYAGNSAGDNEAVQYVLLRHEKNPKKNPGFVIVVHPKGDPIGKLRKLVKQHQPSGNLVEVGMP